MTRLSAVTPMSMYTALPIRTAGPGIPILLSIVISIIITEMMKNMGTGTA